MHGSAISDVPPVSAPAPGSSSARPARKVLRHALWLWLPLSLAVISALMIAHSVSLPVPAHEDPVLTRAMLQLRVPGAQPSWLVAHVLYTECACSRSMLDHLISRPHPSGVQETLVLAGNNAEMAARARAHGFRVVTIKPEELRTRFSVVSVPMLIVDDPEGHVRYAGGYTTSKRGPDPQDLEIIATLQRASLVAELPVFGCAVSKELQAELDPLGLKYSKGR